MVSVGSVKPESHVPRSTLIQSKPAHAHVIGTGLTLWILVKFAVSGFQSQFNVILFFLVYFILLVYKAKIQRIQRIPSAKADIVSLTS
jgi:hypothetical protein